MIQLNVYSDSVISVSLIAEDLNGFEKKLMHLAVRWLRPAPYRDKAGNLVQVTNIMGGETDWFALPFSFSTAIGKKLVEQKAAGLQGFQEDGFAKMVAWLVHLEVMEDAMCY